MKGTTVRPARRTVLGEFADATGARRAIEAIQLHGFDGGEIAIAGEQAERADADLERERPDKRAVGYVGRRVATGAALGVVLGLIVGGAAAAVLLAVGDSASATGAGIGALMMGAFLGGALGALWNAYRTVGTNADAWQATFHDTGGGSFGVTVACRSEHDVDRAISVLRDAGSERVAVVDARNRRVGMS